MKVMMTKCTELCQRKGHHKRDDDQKPELNSRNCHHESNEDHTVIRI